MKKNIPNYWDYLNLKPLLSIQGGLESNESALETDELHFIITHQALELWFKLMLAEMRLARDHLASPKLAEEQVPHVVHLLVQDDPDVTHARCGGGSACPLSQTSSSTKQKKVHPRSMGRHGRFIYFPFFVFKRPELVRT